MRTKSIHRVTTVVSEVDQVAANVIAYTLVDPEGWELPPATAGAHIDVHLPSGLVRQYSLCGDPLDHRKYRIAVARDDSGRGGSLQFHRDVSPGTQLLISLPRNLFPLAKAQRHVMIAGGIGITPFLSMLPELRNSRADFELHYCTRSPESAAFGGEIATLAGAHGHFHFSETASPSRLDIAALLTGIDDETHVYCCGPSRMIEAVRALAGDALGERLHTESFGSATGAAKAFELQLARTGVTIAVPQGQSALQALRAAGIELPSSCEAGVCLECKTRVLGGVPIHLDLVMSAEDRKSFFTPCVSGCQGPALVLDL